MILRLFDPDFISTSEMIFSQISLSTLVTPTWLAQCYFGVLPKHYRQIKWSAGKNQGAS
jgi:hypothetical protein